MSKCIKCKKEKSINQGIEKLNPANGKFIFLCNDCIPKCKECGLKVIDKLDSDSCWCDVVITKKV